MPFLAAGGGAGAPAAAPVTMQVEPDRILALKARYEAVLDTVKAYLEQNQYKLIARPLADDEVSRDAASTFTENSTKAIEVTGLFIDELSLNIDQLQRAAKAYQLVEDTNTTAMRQQTRGI